VIVQQHVRLSIIRACALVIVVVSASGCGQPQSYLGSVTGTVTKDGEPVANMMLEFYPNSGGRPSLAVSDENGRFKALYLENQPGAKVGTHTIRYELGTGQLPDDITPAQMKRIIRPELCEGTVLSPTVVDVKLGENFFSLELVSETATEAEVTDGVDAGSVGTESSGTESSGTESLGTESLGTAEVVPMDQDQDED
jgi:hypothetical protein